MNILTDPLPTSITVGGKEFEINTDFRICILMEECIEDDELSDPEKMMNILIMFLGERIQDLKGADDMKEAFEQIMHFYRSAATDTQDNQDNDQVEEKVYSNSYDAEYIFSAFLQAYHIDLTETSLHWWKYKALLQSLPEETMFAKIVGYRSVKDMKGMSKEMKQHYERMKRLFALPLKKTQPKEDQLLIAAIMNGKGIKSVLNK